MSETESPDQQQAREWFNSQLGQETLREIDAQLRGERIIGVGWALIGATLCLDMHCESGKIVTIKGKPWNVRLEVQR